MSSGVPAGRMYLIDALSLIFQVFHAIPEMSSPKGLPTNALFGFARDLLTLRELKPGLEVVAVQPDSPYHALEGLKHMPSALVPAIYDPSVHQRVIEVASEEAIEMAKRQGRLGLPLGASAGAAVVAAARVARALERGLVVVVLPDSAERYLGDPLWEDPA